MANINIEFLHKDEIGWFERGKHWAAQRDLYSGQLDRIKVTADKLVEVPEEFQKAFAYGVKSYMEDAAKSSEHRRNRYTKAHAIAEQIFS